MTTALTLLLALPLLGFLYSALIGWRMPRQLSGLIANFITQGHNTCYDCTRFGCPGTAIC